MEDENGCLREAVLASKKAKEYSDNELLEQFRIGIGRTFGCNTEGCHMLYGPHRSVSTSESIGECAVLGSLVANYKESKYAKELIRGTNQPDVRSAFSDVCRESSTDNNYDDLKPKDIPTLEKTN